MDTSIPQTELLLRATEAERLNLGLVNDNLRYRKALDEARRSFNDILTIHWGWDGDCGALDYANDGFDVCDEALKAPSDPEEPKSSNAAGASSPSPSSSSPATVREQMEPRVHRVAIQLCELCLEGKPGECHTPGCALFLHDSPGHPILPELYEILVPSGIVEQPKKETNLGETLSHQHKTTAQGQM